LTNIISNCWFDRRYYLLRLDINPFFCSHETSRSWWNSIAQQCMNLTVDGRVTLGTIISWCWWCTSVSIVSCRWGVLWCSHHAVLSELCRVCCVCVCVCVIGNRIPLVWNGLIDYRC
jgi:hypothetical protein